MGSKDQDFIDVEFVEIGDERIPVGTGIREKDSSITHQNSNALPVKQTIASSMSVRDLPQWRDGADGV